VKSPKRIAGGSSDTDRAGRPSESTQRHDTSALLPDQLVPDRQFFPFVSHTGPVAVIAEVGRCWR
jgi:hypothetical protein